MSQHFFQSIVRRRFSLASGKGWLLPALLLILCPGRAAHASENFEDSEIRVIKNKYFEKSMRLELSAGLASVMNQAFLYTYLGGVNVGFHFTEQFGVQGEAYLGQTVRKGDCDTLGTSFRIDPVVQEIKNYFGGAVSYTPIYGKFQMASGRVIYFDWFFEAGAGISRIRSGGVGCAAGGSSSEEVPVEGSALSVLGSTGQRIFLNENVSFNWRVRLMRAEGIRNDGANNAKKSGLGADAQNYVLLNLGVSYFL